jgi:hypothetical protein
MPLTNRVSPFGELLAVTARGSLMGNRGGRIHDCTRELTRRRWASRTWICCRLAFKSRHREVWGTGYTELFFLDETTALAAGHRPCFECRRAAALAFATAWARACGVETPPSAAQMDRILHDERLQGHTKRLHPPCSALPDGAFIVIRSESGTPYAVRRDGLLRWTPSGYEEARPRAGADIAHVLTPPAILAALAAGYTPLWHASAERL